MHRLEPVNQQPATSLVEIFVPLRQLDFTNIHKEHAFRIECDFWLVNGMVSDT